MPSGYSSTAAGGALVPDHVLPLLIEPLMSRSVVLEAGPQRFDAQGAPVRVPRIDTLPLADPWRAENVEIAETDPVYDELTLLPTSLKSLKVIHRISNELARNAEGDVASLVSDALVRRIAVELDKAFLVGDGAANTITGLRAQTGAQVVAAVGAPTIDDLYDAEQLLMAANADPASAVWFMAPRSLTSLRKVKDTAGQYLMQPSPTEQGRMTLLGHPVYVSTQIPTNEGAGTNESSIILADMAQVAVAVDQDVTLTLLNERYGEFDQIGLRVTARFDIGALNPEAVVALNGVTA